MRGIEEESVGEGNLNPPSAPFSLVRRRERIS
jgi:hypothetical protein